MGLFQLGGCNLRKVSAIVTFTILFFLSIQVTDTTSGAINYDEMTINWHIETIDEGLHIIPGRTSIAVDPWGGIHVSYHDGVADGLRYAFKPPDGRWSSEVIDSAGVGNFSEIGVDSQGVVHLAYQDRVGQALKYAVKSPDGQWGLSIVDPGPRSGDFPTIDIDKDDNVYITYMDRSPTSIKMATLDDMGEWAISSVVDFAFSSWGELDLAISDNGSMHLVYLAGSRTPQYMQPYYAYKWPGEEWRKELEPFKGGSDHHLSIALNENGRPYIAASGGATLLHRGPSGRWSSYQYFEDELFFNYGDIRYDSNGYWLICGQTGHKDLRYYQFTPVGSFRTGIIDGSVGAGLHASMAVGPLDRYHIVYYDESNGRLVYATDINRPSEPINLSATGGERDILLEWEMPTYLGNASSISFNIYRNGPRIIGYELYRSGWTGTSFLDTDVENRGYYRYFVFAVNGAGEGDNSTHVWAFPLLHPTKPLNVTAAAGQENVVLRWEPPEDLGEYIITGYRIHWQTGTYWSGMGPEWQYPVSEWSNVTVDSPTNTFNHSNLSQGYTYHYEIAALHAGGEGERSEDVSAIPMAPPRQPMALNASRGDGRIFINWTRPVDDGGCRLTAFKVYRGTSPFDLELLTTIKGQAGDWNLWQEPSLRLVDNGTVPEEVGWRYDLGRDYIFPRYTYIEPGELDDMVTYYYQVSAVQLAGEGPRSEVLEVPPNIAPNPPQDLQGQVVDGGVKLTWRRPIDNGVDPPKGYVIYRTDQDGDPIKLKQVGKDSRSYVDKDIVPNVTYTYYVRGFNAFGEGASSNLEEVSVGVVNTDSDPSDDGEDRVLLYTAIAILTIGLVLGAVVMRKRRGRRDDSDRSINNSSDR